MDKVASRIRLLAVGFLAYFLYRSLLGVVGDTAHIEAVLDMLQILAITVE